MQSEKNNSFSYNIDALIAFKFLLFVSFINRDTASKLLVLTSITCICFVSVVSVILLKSLFLKLYLFGVYFIFHVALYLFNSTLMMAEFVVDCGITSAKKESNWWSRFTTLECLSFNSCWSFSNPRPIAAHPSNAGYISASRWWWIASSKLST